MTPRGKALTFLLLIILILVGIYVYMYNKYGSLMGTTWVYNDKETTTKFYFNYSGKVEITSCGKNGNGNCTTSSSSYTKNDINGFTYKITNNQLIVGEMVLVKS